MFNLLFLQFFAFFPPNLDKENSHVLISWSLTNPMVFTMALAMINN